MKLSSPSPFASHHLQNLFTGYLICLAFLIASPIASMLHYFMDCFNHIKTGGQNGPLRGFDKYLINGLVDLHKTL